MNVDPLALARPEILALKPYEHAAWDPRLERLHANESPWRVPNDESGAGLNRYPEPQPKELVEALAALYGVSPQQLLVGRGSDEGIDLLTRAFCAAGRDAVLVCPPTFGMYAVAARIQGAGVVSVPLRREAGFALDLPALEAALGIEFIKRLTDDLLYIKNQERQGFVDISDADLEFKQSELKKERSKLERRKKERAEAQEDLDAFRQQYDEAKKRFQAAFHTEPEARETQRENEKKRIQASTRHGQVDNEIKTLCEKTLPLAVAGKLFGGLKRRIEAERGSSQQDAIRDNAATLTQTLLRAMAELAEQGVCPVSVSLCEPSLESLFLEAAKA